MINKIYIHYKNKKKYKIIDFCQIQENNIWTDGVIYTEQYNYEIKYVKPLFEFHSKFKLSNEDE